MGMRAAGWSVPPGTHCQIARVTNDWPRHVLKEGWRRVLVNIGS